MLLFLGGGVSTSCYGGMAGSQLKTERLSPVLGVLATSVASSGAPDVPFKVTPAGLFLRTRYFLLAAILLDGSNELTQLQGRGKLTGDSTAVPETSTPRPTSIFNN